MNPGGMTLDRPGVGTARTRSLSINKALYFQSKYGLTKIENLATGVCRSALQPRHAVDGLPLPGGFNIVTYGNVNTGGSNNWLANGFQVAYRITICRKGANGELIESEPSDRIVVSNTIGSSGYVGQHAPDSCRPKRAAPRAARGLPAPLRRVSRMGRIQQLRLLRFGLGFRDPACGCKSTSARSSPTQGGCQRRLPFRAGAAVFHTFPHT